MAGKKKTKSTKITEQDLKNVARAHKDWKRIAKSSPFLTMKEGKGGKEIILLNKKTGSAVGTRRRSKKK